MPEIAQGKTNDPYFITVKDAAGILKMSPKFVYQLIDRNKTGMPHRHFGRKIRIPFEEFIAWTKKQTKGK